MDIYLDMSNRTLGEIEKGRASVNFSAELKEFYKEFKRLLKSEFNLDIENNGLSFRGRTGEVRITGLMYKLKRNETEVARMFLNNREIMLSINGGEQRYFPIDEKSLSTTLEFLEDLGEDINAL